MLDQVCVATQRCVEGVEPRWGYIGSSTTRDGDLAAAAQACLRASSYRGVQSLRCECRRGVLVLRGRVGSYHQKQLAQECVRAILGVRQVVNRVEVID